MGPGISFSLVENDMITREEYRTLLAALDDMRRATETNYRWQMSSNEQIKLDIARTNALRISKVAHSTLDKLPE